MTRRHRRCRTRKGRPVSSRTATVSLIVRHSQGLGEISRLPTEHQTVLRSSRQSVPSLAFRRFLPSARELRAWIPPSFGLRPPAPSHEQREPERLCLEAPIYSASVNGEVMRKVHKSKHEWTRTLLLFFPSTAAVALPLERLSLCFATWARSSRKDPELTPAARALLVGAMHTIGRLGLITVEAARSKQTAPEWWAVGNPGPNCP